MLNVIEIILLTNLQKYKYKDTLINYVINKYRG